ncbi:hippocalcin-like protein 1 [Ylistrum balloti]|uniref:hippocalcin-like protein 1 n=1 Tax=Ylistrum balloti TaxID=509963 RepID=UPI002905CD13|nr:hippocalcin-like protein 1 [Ylistrum balloti]
MGNKPSSLRPKTLKELREFLSEEYTNDVIKTWYEEYKSSLTKGESSLTRDAFIKVYSNLFEGEASNFAAEVFRVFDSDGNGVVDFKEFMFGIYVSGCSMNEDMKLDWAFRMYDRNGDGFISKEEMTYMFKAIYRMTKPPSTHSTPEKLTDYFFECFDKNKDDQISDAEFIAEAKKNRLIVDMLEIDPCG